MVVDSNTFEVEGRIALADLPENGSRDSEGHERRREGRLNDVLIVLERDAPAIEQAILARLRGMDLAGGETSVRLTFDDRAPRFAVAISPAGADPAAGRVLESRAGAIADEVEHEILGAIARRTSAARHFSPEVEVHPKGTWPAGVEVERPAAPRQQASRPRRVRTTIWLQILFFLIASVLFAALYLYLTQTG